MEETTYDSESLLQKLLADHPDLLAGDQINVEEPRRWLLVTREMAVPGEQDGAGKEDSDQPADRPEGAHPENSEYGTPA